MSHGRPTTTEDISHRLDTLEAELDELDKQLTTAEDTWVHLDAGAELDYAVAFIGADKQPMDMRKQLAIEATYQARLDARVARNEVTRLARTCRRLERKIETMRSRGALLRGELALGGSGYRT